MATARSLIMFSSQGSCRIFFPHLPHFSANISPLTYMPILWQNINCLLLTHSTVLMKLEKFFSLKPAATAQTAEPGEIASSTTSDLGHQAAQCPTWERPSQPSEDWQLLSLRRQRPVLLSPPQRCASSHLPPSQRQLSTRRCCSTRNLLRG